MNRPTHTRVYRRYHTASVGDPWRSAGKSERFPDDGALGDTEPDGAETVRSETGTDRHGPDQPAKNGGELRES